MSLGTVPEGVAQPDSLGASVYVLLPSKGAGLPYSMLSSHWLGAPLSLHMYIAPKGSHRGRILGEGSWKPKHVRADGGAHGHSKGIPQPLGGGSVSCTPQNSLLCFHLSISHPLDGEPLGSKDPFLVTLMLVRHGGYYFTPDKCLNSTYWFK